MRRTGFAFRELLVVLGIASIVAIFVVAALRPRHGRYFIVTTRRGMRPLLPGQASSIINMGNTIGNAFIIPTS